MVGPHDRCAKHLCTIYASIYTQYLDNTDYEVSIYIIHVENKIAHTRIIYNSALNKEYINHKVFIELTDFMSQSEICQHHRL